MLSCLEHMYHDLGLVRDFGMNPITLKRWLVSAGPRAPVKHTSVQLQGSDHLGTFLMVLGLPEIPPGLAASLWIPTTHASPMLLLW